MEALANWLAGARKAYLVQHPRTPAALALRPEAKELRCLRILVVTSLALPSPGSALEALVAPVVFHLAAFSRRELAACV